MKEIKRDKRNESLYIKEIKSLLIIGLNLHGKTSRIGFAVGFSLKDSFLFDLYPM